jgi:hypothetical protein
MKETSSSLKDFDGTSTPVKVIKDEKQTFIPFPRKFGMRNILILHVYCRIVVKTKGEFPEEIKENFFKICSSMDPKKTGLLGHSDIYKALALSVRRPVQPVSPKTETSPSKNVQKSESELIHQKTINNIMNHFPTDGSGLDYKRFIQTIDHSFDSLVGVLLIFLDLRKAIDPMLLYLLNP